MKRNPMTAQQTTGCVFIAAVLVIACLIAFAAGYLVGCLFPIR